MNANTQATRAVVPVWALGGDRRSGSLGHDEGGAFEHQRCDHQPPGVGVPERGYLNRQGDDRAHGVEHDRVHPPPVSGLDELLRRGGVSLLLLLLGLPRLRLRPVGFGWCLFGCPWHVPSVA
ncbi:hypothetical protein ABZ622_27680 [Streptomyces sp. NPDC007164]|uniref:hypothetical protein n=1 Tax=Streptomyces sp. NPDC007164 TaxID=3156918 RepID=UPI0033EA87E2